MAKTSLPRTSPESQGLSSQAVLDFLDDAARKGLELHSFMLVRNGCVIAEGWWNPYQPHLRHSLYSLSKSFTATAIGMAVEENLLNLTDRVVDFFPDKRPSSLDARWQALTVEHLLTMTTGHREDTLERVLGAPDGDWIKAFFACPLELEPGTTFVYNTPATYMLSAILQRAAGEKLIDYLRPRLFEPLGIADPVWLECPQGINTGGFGLSITTEDIAKFGLLFLNKGMWNGVRLISADWINRASSKQVSNFVADPTSDWQQGYGYQMWMCRHRAYRGDGAFGQFCVVMPEQNAVVAITAGVPTMQPVLDCIWDNILPHFGETLPENPGLHSRLQDRLSRLSLPILPGEWNAGDAAKIDGQRYTLEPNELGLTWVEFAADRGEIQLTLGEKGKAVTLKAGFGRYAASQTEEEGLCQACAAWEDESTLVVLARFVETPFSRTAVMRFIGDELTLEIKQNCSFGPAEHPPVKGRRARRD